MQLHGWPYALMSHIQVIESTIHLNFLCYKKTKFVIHGISEFEKVDNFYYIILKTNRFR